MVATRRWIVAAIIAAVGCSDGAKEKKGKKPAADPAAVADSGFVPQVRSAGAAGSNTTGAADVAAGQPGKIYAAYPRRRAKDPITAELPPAFEGMVNTPVPAVEVVYPRDRQIYRVHTLIVRPFDELISETPVEADPALSNPYSYIPPEGISAVRIARRWPDGAYSQIGCYRTVENRLIYVAKSSDGNGLLAKERQLISPLPSKPMELLPMPGPVSQMRLAGNGRFLICAVAEAQKVLTADIRTGTILRTLVVPAERFLVAGGATRFVVVDTVNNRLTRYAYETKAGEYLQTDVDMTKRRRIIGAAIGASSEGPLWLSFETDQSSIHAPFALPYDLETLQPLKLAKIVPSGTLYNFLPEYTAVDQSLIADHDGRSVFTTRVGFQKASLSGDTLILRALAPQQFTPIEGEPLRPAHDGSYLFAGKGLYFKSGKNYRHMGASYYTAPCTDSNYWMLISERNWVEGIAPEISFKLGFREVDVAELDCEVIGTKAEFDSVKQKPYVRDRYIYSNEEKCLVVLPATARKVGLKHADVEKYVAEDPEEFMALSASPPFQFSRSFPVTEELRAVSSRGPVTFELRSGPPGMTVLADGFLEWTPDESVETGNMVELFLKSTTGRRESVRFELREMPSLAGNVKVRPAADSTTNTSPTPATNSKPDSPRPSPSPPPPAVAAKPAREARQWTSADGKFQVEAVLRGILNDKVLLTKTDGVKIEVPLSVLSAADRDYVRTQYPQAK